MAADRVDRIPWPSVLLLTGVGVITAGQIFKLSPALAFVGDDLGLSLVQRGWLFSIINATAALLGVMAGSVADSAGVRRTLIGALLVIAVAAGLGSTANGFVPAITLRLVEGIAILAAVASIPALIISLTPPARRPLALSVWVFYMPVGAALATWLGGMALGTFEWRQIWLVTASLSVLAAGLISFGIRPSTGPAHPTGIGNLWQGVVTTVRQPPARGLFFAMLCFAAMHGPFMAWLPSFLIEERGMQAAAAGALAGIIVVANVTGNLLAGLLLTHGLQFWQVLAIAGVITLVTGTGMFLPLLPDWTRLVCAVLYSALCGLIPATAYAAVPQVIVDARYTGTMNGFIIQGAQTGHLLGPPLFAGLVTRAGGDWSVGSWQYAILSLLIIGIALWLRGSNARSVP